MTAPVGQAAPGSTAGNDVITVDRYSFIYPGGKYGLRDVSLSVPRNQILTLMGPAQSGKSTLLRSLNRMTDMIPGVRREGVITLDGKDIHDPDCDPSELRRRVGMVFDTPVPLSRSIYENIVFGPRLKGIRDKARLDRLVEQCLQAAILWDEVKDRLQISATRLSGGQQQRLCIARALALQPEVLLLDEPTSGLDPVSTLKIEEALAELKSHYTIILVTNNTKQAARVADSVAFFLMGELVEHGPASRVFTVPADSRTDDYISGRFG